MYVAPQKVFSRENGRVQEKMYSFEKISFFLQNYHRVANKIKCWYLENQLQQVLVIVKMYETKE